MDDYNDDSSEESSSASSDEEYLTTQATGKAASEQDREAIIQKKLLESFYGAASPTSGSTPSSGDNLGPSGTEASPSATDESSPPPLSGAASSTEKTNSSATGMATNRRHVAPSHPNGATVAHARPHHHNRTPSHLTSDLDSPAFDPDRHTTTHIQSSTTQTLLQTNENLALQIRPLDSTMQTLVYENYSKFIDATDAIRSIGQSVSANEEGLARLETGIHRIESGSRDVDSAVRTSRDAVAEKLRVKRLLSRLDIAQIAHDA